MLSAWTLFLLAAWAPLGHLAVTTWANAGDVPATDAVGVLLAMDQWRLFAHSLMVAGGAALLALVLGCAYALAVERTALPARRLLLVLGCVPLLIPPQLHGIVWAQLLAPNGPVYTVAFAPLGFARMPVDVFSALGVVCVLGLAWFPVGLLLISAGLRAIDPVLEEAARLRAGPRAMLTGVTLPLLRPYLLAAALLVFVFALIDFGVPDLLRVRLYPIEIFIEFSALYDQPAAVRLAVPLLAVTWLLVGLTAWSMRGRAFVSLAQGAGDATRYRFAAPRVPALIFCGSVIVAAVLVPLLAMTLTAGPALFDPSVMVPAIPAIRTSVLLALGAAALATGLGLVIAWGLVRARPVWRGLLDALVLLPLAWPPILLGVALIGLWNRPGTGWLYDSLVILLVGLVARFLPFAIRVLDARLHQFNPRLLEAARLASPDGARVALRIALPLLSDGLAAAFLIVFVLAISELGVSLLVMPPGVETLPVRIYNLMHYGAHAAVAALSLLLVGLQLAVALLLLPLARGVRA